MFTIERLVHDLRQLGINPGEMLAVHASMKKIGGHIEGGPASVIHALLEVIGEEGTLVIPVFNHPADVIDLRTAPSRLGIISETFRQWPGVRRSNNATHSVAACGRDAEAIISAHENCAALDVDSPLHKVAQRGGKILHLGTDLSSCSLVHVAESMVDVPYQRIAYPGYDRDIPYTGTDGVERVQLFNKSPGDSDAFPDLAELAAVQAICVSGKIGHAHSYLFEAQGLLTAAVNVLKQDPQALLCHRAACKVCGQRRALLSH